MPDPRATEAIRLIQELDNSLTDTKGDLFTTQARVAELEATNATLINTNARLTRELADCLDTEPEVPEPEPTGTIFGTSTPMNSAGFKLPVVAERSYLQPGETPTTIAGDSGLSRCFREVTSDGLVWFSIKEKAGPWLKALVDDMQAKHPKIQLIITADHEPYDNWYEKGATGIAEYHARQQALEDLLLGRKGVTLVTVLEGWHQPGRSPGYYDAMYRPKQGWGADSYNAPADGVPTAYRKPEVSHGAVVAYAKSKGKDPYIGETGSGVKTGDLAGRSTWIREQRAYWQTNAKVVCYFNARGSVLTAPELELWLKG